MTSGLPNDVFVAMTVHLRKHRTASRTECVFARFSFESSQFSDKTVALREVLLTVMRLASSGGWIPTVFRGDTMLLAQFDDFAVSTTVKETRVPMFALFGIDLQYVAVELNRRTDMSREEVFDHSNKAHRIVGVFEDLEVSGVIFLIFVLQRHFAGLVLAVESSETKRLQTVELATDLSPKYQVIDPNIGRLGHTKELDTETQRHREQALQLTSFWARGPKMTPTSH